MMGFGKSANLTKPRPDNLDPDNCPPLERLHFFGVMVKVDAKYPEHRPGGIVPEHFLKCTL